MIPLKANVPAWRLAWATLAVAAGCAVACAVLLDRTALVWPAVFLMGNLLAIWTFGSGVEPLAGPVRTFILLTGAAVLAAGANALAGTPLPPWTVVSAAPALAALVALALLRPRVRVITLSVLPVVGGVTEVPLAVIAAAWLALEGVAVVAW